MPKKTPLEKLKMKTKIESTLDDILDSYDWESVFGECEYANADGVVESDDGTPTDPVARTDIAEVIASVDGENDGDDWIGVFKLKDGRFLAASGWCDYTGWG